MLWLRVQVLQTPHLPLMHMQVWNTSCHSSTAVNMSHTLFTPPVSPTSSLTCFDPNHHDWMDVESLTSSGKNPWIHFCPYPKRPVLNPSCKHPHAILVQSRGSCSDLSNPRMGPSEVNHISIFALLSLLIPAPLDDAKFHSRHPGSAKWHSSICHAREVCINREKLASASPRYLGPWRDEMQGPHTGENPALPWKLLFSQQIRIQTLA